MQHDSHTAHDNAIKSTILKHADEQAAKPKQTDLVSVHYTGRLMNADGSEGKEFDSSVKRGTPFEFHLGVGYVIKGWDIAVSEMKVGEKRKVVIPPALGYGDYGIPGVIPQKATLIFEIELLAIKPSQGKKR